jgi:hypothetical protein
VAKKCLEIIETHWKGPQTPLAKVAVICDVTTTLTSTTPQFAKTKVNNALGSYLKIISQCDQSGQAASGSGNSNTNSLAALGKPSSTSKQTLSPDLAAGSGK